MLQLVERLCCVAGVGRYVKIGLSKLMLGTSAAKFAAQLWIVFESPSILHMPRSHARILGYGCTTIEPHPRGSICTLYNYNYLGIAIAGLALHGRRTGRRYLINPIATRRPNS